MDASPDIHEERISNSLYGADQAAGHGLVRLQGTLPEIPFSPLSEFSLRRSLRGLLPESTVPTGSLLSGNEGFALVESLAVTACKLIRL